MSRGIFLFVNCRPPAWRGAWRVARLGVVAGCAVLGAYAADSSGAPASPAPAISNAPTVRPAPVLEQPLPPAVSQEVSEPQPTAQHVWVPGHWRWQEGNHVWIAPHWELPPIANATWVEPRWEKSANGYVLVEGYWQPPANGTAVATVASPPPAVPAEVTIVSEPPPSPRREIIVERPSMTHVWISGYWGWRGGQHVWVSGHWERPPRPHAVWVEPRWERRGNGYFLVEGYWREIDEARAGGGAGVSGSGQIIVRRPAAEVVILHEPPPPPRVERHGPAPSPYHRWIAGYWFVERGRQTWVPGHWEVPPRGRTVWIEPRWERRDGGYFFIGGSWR